jgi:hypothetical protein
MVSAGDFWPGQQELSRYLKYMARTRVPEFESDMPSHAVVLSQVRSPAIVMHPLVYRPNTMPAWPEQTSLLFSPRMLYFAQRRSGLTPVLRAEE